MGAKVCILCGSPPPLTGEHIWSDWYNRKTPERRYQLEAIYDDVVRLQSAQGLGLKPRVLCNQCNSHWGSMLEERVEPILAPMLDGGASGLTLRAMRLLVGWFTLKCMASRYLVPDPPYFFSAEDGAHLLATLMPPPVARVWIGRYVGKNRDAGWIMNRQGAHDLPLEEPTGILWYATTYSIGQVLLHFFDFKGPIATDGRHVEENETLAFHIAWAPGDWASTLTPIWPLPTERVAWPPPKAFDDDGFKYLARRWDHLHSGGEPEK